MPGLSPGTTYTTRSLVATVVTTVSAYTSSSAPIEAEASATLLTVSVPLKNTHRETYLRSSTNACATSSIEACAALLRFC